MGSVYLSHWMLYCECYSIFRWFLRCLYLFYGCLVVDTEVNFWIWYDWLLLCIFCCLELVGGVLWGLVFIVIIIIPIHSCDIDISNRTTSAVYEDKLIWFISD